MFSVQFAYRMMIETKKRREDWIEKIPHASDSAAECSGWKRLWSVKVPGELLFFAWRLAQASLPTGEVRHDWCMAALQHARSVMLKMTRGVILS